MESTRSRLAGLPRLAGDAPSSAPTRLDLALARRVARALEPAPLSLVLWDGRELPPADVAPRARLHLCDRGALVGLVVDAEQRFGELYCAGRIEVEGDLVEALELAYGAPLSSPSRWRSLRERANTSRRSRHHVHHHYDLGNEFYSLWLDREAMQYTCAYYPSPDCTLEEAQRAKLDHVCRKLWLRPGERVVEAGCGWGGLALHMARHYGVRVRAYNVSTEQIDYANESARRAGLDDRVEFVHDDYREIRGRFDAFVSVGMLEHVGPARYAALGAVIERCLAAHGRGLVHTIGRDRPLALNRWIRRRIFPGAYPPTLREVMELFEPHGLSVLDVENLRLHYARTLREWLARFEAGRREIEATFDAPFVRAWRLYLSGSIAAFTTGWLQLFQVVFARSGSNGIPTTRRHLYPPDA
jgi:cyclopropane-fatty-acyl-phospholipid synthase